MSRGRKPVAVTYWYSARFNRILNPPPEWFPIPEFLLKQGFVKIVCRSAHDVEIWSEKLRDQEKRDKEIEDQRRHFIEAPWRAKLRGELLYLQATARDNFNREFCRRAIEKIDQLEQRNRETLTRISYQHCEGFEEKKH